jgi:hypothetical protein
MVSYINNIWKKVTAHKEKSINYYLKRADFEHVIALNDNDYETLEESINKKLAE